MLNIKVDEGATIPSRGSEYAAGLDLSASESITIPQRSLSWVSTGLRVAIAPYLCGQIWPRSGLAGKGISTSAGIVDADYRGEVKVLLRNETDEPFAVVPGMRIAQLLIVPVARPNVMVVEDLDGTERGEDGFGSTGG